MYLPTGKNTIVLFKKIFMAPFYGYGLPASKLLSHYKKMGYFLTPKFPRGLDTYLADHRRVKGAANHGAT